MTPNEAANTLTTMGFQVKVMSGTPLLILGAQGYDPPYGLDGVGAFTGQAFDPRRGHSAYYRQCPLCFPVY